MKVKSFKRWKTSYGNRAYFRFTMPVGRYVTPDDLAKLFKDHEVPQTAQIILIKYWFGGSRTVVRVKW